MIFSPELMNISGLGRVLQGEVVSLEGIQFETTDYMVLHGKSIISRPNKMQDNWPQSFLAKQLRMIPCFQLGESTEHQTSESRIYSRYLMSVIPKRKPKPGSGYFVLTCDEAYEQKRGQTKKRK